MNRISIAKELLNSGEPSIRWKMRTRVFGEALESKAILELQEEIRKSPRVLALLGRRSRGGRLERGNNVYQKWQGAHWTLAALADIGYPAGDAKLIPIREQILDFWLGERFYREFEAKTKADVYTQEGVPVMRGRHRRCASQQGNALYCLLKLGLADKRTERLAERLIHWQWPDGGWNCDKTPGADTSSFMETLLPMLGLGLLGRMRNNKQAAKAARKASEVFLSRDFFKRRSNGKIIHPEFLSLHYPLYWHYDILGGLKAMAELGLIKDPRCSAALDLLESRELADGGWAAEKRYYKVSKKVELGAEFVDWGGTGKKKMNPWVTADALYVLNAAGRFPG